MTGNDNLIDPALRKQIEAEKWFHAIDFGDFSVPSYFYAPDQLPNALLFPAFRFFTEISLAGMRCLDMGTYDGLTAFVLDRMGAGRIDATCQFDLKRFRLAQRALNPEHVVYHPETQLEELIDRFGEASFDLVIVSLALHHLTLPQEGLFICRRLLKRGGLFILAAGVFHDPEPALLLNPEMKVPIAGVPNIWVPTDGAIEGMLRLAAFDLVARTDLAMPEAFESNRRLFNATFLSRAVRPADIRGRTEAMVAIQDTAKWTGRIDYRALSRADWPESSIVYRGPDGLRPLTVETRPVIPLQPRWSPPSPPAEGLAQAASTGS